MHSVEIVSMAYRSPSFLKFTWEQMGKWSNGAARRVVLNDPRPEVLECARREHMTYSLYQDAEPESRYLSRVYRAWNMAVRSSAARYVVLVNSDMAFSPGWLDALMEWHAPDTLVTSRLVEHGRIGVGQHALEIPLGTHPDTFAIDAWEKVAREAAGTGILPGGCYMPVVWERETFIRIGGYPEGNVADGKVVQRMPNGDKSYVSGDKWLFDRSGLTHVTALGSVVYHMQEGERRA